MDPLAVTRQAFIGNPRKFSQWVFWSGQQQILLCGLSPYRMIATFGSKSNELVSLA